MAAQLPATLISLITMRRAAILTFFRVTRRLRTFRPEYTARPVGPFSRTCIHRSRSAVTAVSGTSTCATSAKTPSCWPSGSLLEQPKERTGHRQCVTMFLAALEGEYRRPLMCGIYVITSSIAPHVSVHLLAPWVGVEGPLTLSHICDPSPSFSSLLSITSGSRIRTHLPPSDRDLLYISSCIGPSGVSPCKWHLSWATGSPFDTSRPGT